MKSPATQPVIRLGYSDLPPLGGAATFYPWSSGVVESHFFYVRVQTHKHPLDAQDSFIF